MSCKRSSSGTINHLAASRPNPKQRFSAQPAPVTFLLFSFFGALAPPRRCRKCCGANASPFLGKNKRWYTESRGRAVALHPDGRKEVVFETRCPNTCTTAAPLRRNKGKIVPALTFLLFPEKFTRRNNARDICSCGTTSYGAMKKNKIYV